MLTRRCISRCHSIGRCRAGLHFALRAADRRPRKKIALHRHRWCARIRTRSISSIGCCSATPGAAAGSRPEVDLAVALHRSISRGRSRPRPRQASQRADLSRRIAEALTLGTSQAGGRRRGDHRRARRIPAEREGPGSTRATSSSRKSSRSSRRAAAACRSSTTSISPPTGRSASRWSPTRSGWGFRFLPARRCRSRGGCPRSTCRYGTPLAESVCAGYGGVDSYDFHGLETAQCMSERRQGRRGRHPAACRRCAARRCGSTSPGARRRSGCSSPR